MRTLDYKQLAEYLEYDPETGVITNKVSRRKARAGKVATLIANKGYLRVAIMGVQLLAHRVAWVLYHQTDIPDGMTIEHRDNCGSNNRIDNLMLLSLVLNSGRLGRAKGIQAIRGRWRARIKRKGHTTYGSVRDCPLIAHIDYTDLVKADQQQ